MSKGLNWPGPLLRLKSIDSTQDLAKRLAESGAADRTLIIAERQTKGRGRMSRRWASADGGLYLSAIFRPHVSPRRLGGLSLAVAGAAAQACSRLSGLETLVKPPNDVLARKTGPWKKVCGILIEASGSATTEWVVIGLGLNVNNRIPARLQHAASLNGLSSRRIDLEVVGKRITKALESSYSSWLKRGRRSQEP